jgi:hypothetical protein
MSDGVHMVGAGHLKKLLKLIDGLPCLALEVTLGGGYELPVGIVGLLVMVALIAVGSDYDSLGSPLWPHCCCLWRSSLCPCRLP